MAGNNDESTSLLQSSSKVELKEKDCRSQLAYSFSTRKKWFILSVIFLVQVSLNFNASLYSNAVAGISEEFDISSQRARLGAMIFLIMYAFGCELWAPWSEELGRRPVLQGSLLLVNVFQLPVALAKNFTWIMWGRALGGLSSAGGSVTLGMVPDLFEKDDQQYAVAFVVFSSVAGSVFGPMVGGYIEEYYNWRWNIWVQLIIGVVVQIVHLLFVPETRSSIMVDRIAKSRRGSGEDTNIYGPNEMTSWKERFAPKKILTIWIRPFKMFLTEPIVLSLSLLSGFSDALIFIFLQSFPIVYKQWLFSPYQVGLAFIPIFVGYLLGYLSFFPNIKRNVQERKEHPDDEHIQNESRLWWLLYTAPCLPIGLLGFAWTSSGPPLHWAGSMVFSAIIGIANYSIYMATIDYMIAAYGPYAASATGGNGWARDFLAGALTIPAVPFYKNIGGDRNLEWASTILAGISLILVAAVYVVYNKGQALRERSAFAQELKG